MKTDPPLRYRVVDKSDSYLVLAVFIQIDDAYDYIARQPDSEDLAVYDDLSGTPEQHAGPN